MSIKIGIIYIILFAVSGLSGNELESNPDPVGQETLQSTDGDTVSLMPETPSIWTYSIGIRYRNFKNVDFSPQSFRNLGNSLTGTTATGPGDTAANRTAAQTNGPYGVQNVGSPLNQPEVTVSNSFEGIDQSFNITVPLDTIRFDGSSDPANDQMGGAGAGLSVSVERTLLTRNMWTLGLRAGIQYHGTQAQRLYRGDMFNDGHFTTAQFIHELVDVDGNPFDSVITPVINPAVGANPVTEAGTSTQFSVENELGMDLVALDLGLVASKSTDRLTLRLAIGPTLTFSHFRTSQRLEASWSDINSSFPNPPFSTSPVTVNSGTYSKQESESSKQLTLGGYLSMGISFSVTPALATGITYRYDVVDRTARTDQARLDLDGRSVELFVSFQF